MTQQRSSHSAGARAEKPEYGVKRALERIYESSQSLVIRRIDLLVEEARQLVQDAALGITGCLIALLGWMHVMEGAVAALSRIMPHPGAEFVVGGLHVGLGVGFVLWARAHARKAAGAR
jgi:hypothetical protein